MENYLYFRKQRPVKAAVTLGSATQTCPAFAAADIGVLANNDNENEIAAISAVALNKIPNVLASYHRLNSIYSEHPMPLL